MILKDKVVIITGGSGLIGRECVKDARKKGAIVVNADIAVETDIVNGTYHLDMSDDDSIVDLVSMVYEKYGRIDGIANVAYPRTKDWGAFFEDIPMESWRKNVDMQLNTCFLLCQKVLVIMKMQGFGSIVNFGSIYGVVGNDFTIYEGYVYGRELKKLIVQKQRTTLATNGNALRLYLCCRRASGFG